MFLYDFASILLFVLLMMNSINNNNFNKFQVQGVLAQRQELPTSKSRTQTCLQSDVASLPFCNSSLSFWQRSQDLIQRLTLEEKVAQLMDETPPIERLYIDSYFWWSESLHGIYGKCDTTENDERGHIVKRCPTIYPMPLNAAATFHTQLIYTMATQISTEGRRLFIDQTFGIDDKRIMGLDFWAPNINIFRDPRWGRGQETPGEDPYLSGEYAVAFVTGMQEGEDTRYIKTIATLKHFAAYSLEKWNHYSRHSFDANVTDIDLIQTYLPAFEAGIRRGRAKSVMCSYNAVNGIPTCASSFLLQEILRNQWGFDGRNGKDGTGGGYIVSDCGAIQDVAVNHKYRKNPAEAVTVSIQAGTDLNCGRFYEHVEEAVKQGILPIADVDLALTRLFAARMELGMFDPFEQQPYMNYPPQVVGHPNHVATALQIAQESIVLLKNEGNVLPLDATTAPTLAVLGPHFNSTRDMCGNYYRDVSHVVSPLEALVNTLPAGKVRSEKGCDIQSNDTSGFGPAIELAENSDYAILFLGINGDIENEERDRYDIGLPGVQEQFMQQIANVHKKTILVLINGGAVDISIAVTNPNIVAILEAFLPGMMGGQAISDVMFGKYNPSGRLPYTIHKRNFVDQISMADMSMSNYPGRTYRFFQGEVVFPFGFGLSYTTFKYTMKNVQSTMSATDKGVAQPPQVHYRVQVQNIGSMAGDVSVLGFLSFNGDTTAHNCPKSQLFGFQKIHLDIGETKEVFFAAETSALKCVRKRDAQLDNPDGWYSVRIGDVEHNFHFAEGSIVDMEPIHDNVETNID